MAKPQPKWALDKALEILCRWYRCPADHGIQREDIAAALAAEREACAKVAEAFDHKRDVPDHVMGCTCRLAAAIRNREEP